MFHFGTTHNQERRDGFVSFRCFWLGGGGGERTKEEGRGRRGWKRESGRRGEDFERMEEDFEQDETRALRREKQGLQQNENQAFEKVKTNSGFSVKCDFDSQHSQHSQHFPPKALRMRKLMGG